MRQTPFDISCEEAVRNTLKGRKMARQPPCQVPHAVRCLGPALREADLGLLWKLSCVVCPPHPDWPQLRVCACGDPVVIPPSWPWWTPSWTMWTLVLRVSKCPRQLPSVWDTQCMVPRGSCTQSKKLLLVSQSVNMSWLLLAVISISFCSTGSKKIKLFVLWLTVNNFPTITLILQQSVGLYSVRLHLRIVRGCGGADLWGGILLLTFKITLLLT